MARPGRLNRPGGLVAGYGIPCTAAPGRPPPHGPAARGGDPCGARGRGALPRTGTADATGAPRGPAVALPVQSLPGRAQTPGDPTARGRRAGPARYLRPRTGASG